MARFAAWVHESDERMVGALERRGYTLDTSTRAMGMALDDIVVSRPQIDLGPADWAEYLTMEGLRPVSSVPPTTPPSTCWWPGPAARWSQRRWPTTSALTAGSTTSGRRRRPGGAGWAPLTAAQVHDARARGCRTASLQSTQMAERVYTAVGFRDLGRILEYVALNTHSFQAPGFYTRFGYRECGRTPGYPHGHDDIHLLKLLG